MIRHGQDRATKASGYINQDKIELSILWTDNSHSNASSSDIQSLLLKIESFGPYFEAMQQDAKKLAGQVEESRYLSDRLSGMVT